MTACLEVLLTGGLVTFDDLIEIDDDVLEAFLKTNAAKLPRDALGFVELARDIFEDGTTVTSVWNEVDGFGFLVRNPDFEYLTQRLHNLFPNAPWQDLKRH